MLSVGAAAVAYISCEAAQRLKLADSAKLFALTFLLVTFGAQDGISTANTPKCHLWSLFLHCPEQLAVTQARIQLALHKLPLKQHLTGAFCRQPSSPMYSVSLHLM